MNPMIRQHGTSVMGRLMGMMYNILDKAARKEVTQAALSRPMTLKDIWPTLGEPRPRRTSNRYPTFTKKGPGRYRPSIEAIRARKAREAAVKQ